MFCETLHQSCEMQVLAKVWRNWFDEAVRIEDYLPQTMRMADSIRPLARWLWPSIGHVDREKEMGGAKLALELNQTTLSAECARDGQDWEEVLEQRAKEKELERQLGLAMAEPTQSEETPDDNQAETETPAAD